MFATGGTLVAKGGRPKKDSEKGGTKHVRVNGDLAEKLSWVLQALGPEYSSARLLDPLIRGPILRMYEENEAAITAMQKAQKKARENRVEPPAPAGE